MFFESVQERDDWFRILRRHTGHHRIQNVFQHATAAIGIQNVFQHATERVPACYRVSACYSRYRFDEDTLIVV